MTGRRLALAAAPVRAALYARVSTTDHGQDVGLQLDELRQVAAQRGWTVTEYVDDGVSGAAESRPSLDRMLEDARAGRLDLVAVWRLDRLGRSVSHLVGLLGELEAHHVGFASLRDAGIDTTTPTGRLLLHLLAAFAEFERSLIRERVQAGVDRARARGVRLGRPPVDVPVAAAVELLDGGHGLKDVARMLRVNRNTLRRRLQADGAWPRC